MLHNQSGRCLKVVVLHNIHPTTAEKKTIASLMMRLNPQTPNFDLVLSLFHYGNPIFIKQYL
jgi:hypothetical protein